MNTAYIFNEIFLQDVQDKINSNQMPASLITSSMFHSKQKFQSPRSLEKHKNRQKKLNQTQSKNLNQLLQNQFHRRMRQHRNRRITDHCDSIFYKKYQQSPQNRYKRQSLKEYIDSQSKVMLQDLLKKNEMISPRQQKQILKMKQQRLKNLEKVFHKSEVDLEHNFTGKSYLRKIIQQRNKHQSQIKAKNTFYKFVIAKTTKNYKSQPENTTMSENRIHFNSFEGEKSTSPKRIQIKFRKTMLNFQKQSAGKQSESLDSHKNKVVSLKKKIFIRQNKQKDKIYEKQNTHQNHNHFKIMKFQPHSTKQRTAPAITMNEFFQIEEQQNDKIVPWRRKKQDQQIINYFDYHL